MVLVCCDVVLVVVTRVTTRAGMTTADSNLFVTAGDWPAKGTVSQPR